MLVGCTSFGAWGGKTADGSMMHGKSEIKGNTNCTEWKERPGTGCTRYDKQGDVVTIIDVKSGHQPLANENQDVWIVFNGEIYNHAELRGGLESQGHRYRSRSDTETIVHLYEEYGRDCVQHLRGMFAFVIWDRRKRVLFAARSDHFTGRHIHRVDPG